MRKAKALKISFNDEPSGSATTRTTVTPECSSISPFRSVSERGLSESGDSDYATLVRFSTMIQRPRWEVKFPLVIPSPTPTPSSKPLFQKSKSAKKLTIIREQDSQRETASRPLTESRPRLSSPISASLSPCTGKSSLLARRAFLRDRSSEAMKVIEEKCEELLYNQRRKIRTRTRELKRLRAGLKTCEKHTGLITASNDRAPYYLLRLKFQQIASSK